LQNISRLGFLQLLLLHRHFWPIIDIYITIVIRLLPHTMHADWSRRIRISLLG
jgi:hypothetical protein